jgi:hypothetical protein
MLKRAKKTVPTLQQGLKLEHFGVDLQFLILSGLLQSLTRSSLTSSLNVFACISVYQFVKYGKMDWMSIEISLMETGKRKRQ